MAAVTTSTTDKRRKHAKQQRPTQTSAPASRRAWTPSFLRGDTTTYAALAFKSAAAAALVFGAVSVLSATSERHAARHKSAGKQKLVAGHKVAMAESSAAEHKVPIRRRPAMISGNEVAIRDAPRPNAKILDKAVFGSSVDVVGEDGKWAQVHAAAQKVSGWVEKASLNY